MTSKEQKKQQKKLARAKEVRKKLLVRREAAAAPVREETVLRRKMKRVHRLKNDMGRLNVWSDEALVNMTDKTLTQLERNAKILRALEDEYQEEHAKKENLNKELESEGYYTLEEKLNNLHGKLVHQFGKAVTEAGFPEAANFEKVEATGGLGGQREVSDVEVIRASAE